MPSPGSYPRRRLRLLLGSGAILFVTAVCLGAWWGLRPPHPSPPRRPVSVVISGDTAGWIVPCGCTANQSGGLPRRGTYLKRLRQQHDILVADAGGAPPQALLSETRLLRTNRVSEAGTSAYPWAKFEAILQGEQLLGSAAHNLGGPEAALGPAYLREVGRRLQVPFVSANLRDADGQPVAEPLRILDCAGRRIALAGVLSQRFANQDVHIDDPREALVELLTQNKGRYDSFIVLAYLPEDELRSLAASLPEADAVVGGPTGQSIAPQAAGVTLLASATNKGKFLVRLEAEEQGMRWHWTGQTVEMGPDLADDPDQQSNLDGYLHELEKQDFSATDTGLGPALPPGIPADYRVAGNQACLSCHAQECKLWQSSKHAQAWTTLVQHRYHVEPFCQQCHTTAYGMPGGFESRTRTPQAVAVQCESCHGPSLAHARRPRQRTPQSSRDQCLRCHDPENSPRFDFAAYWEQIRHGKLRSQESGVRGQRSGVRDQESGVRGQRSGVRDQRSEIICDS